MFQTGRMTCHGVFRVYFNKHADAPRVWSITPADCPGVWELKVRAVVFSDVEVNTRYAPKETVDEDDGKPSAFLEVVGWLSASPFNGSAFITKDKPA